MTHLHPGRRTASALVLPVVAALLLVLSGAAPASAAGVRPLPGDAPFDYQIGRDHRPPAGVRVVSRDWYAGQPLADRGTYSICYVNAFQTQDDEDGVDRPDERSNWPADLVLTELGDDPDWGGEYLVDISTPAKRARAAAHLEQMVGTCAVKGFAAVEFDNLDSWTRFDDTPVAPEVPFERAQAVAYAELITDHAHAQGLAVGQKNTVELGRRVSRDVIGFDFAVAEQCGEHDECEGYTAVFGDEVVAIEYTGAGFRAACASVGSTIAVVRRDVDVTAPGSPTYRYKSC